MSALAFRPTAPAAQTVRSRLEDAIAQAIEALDALDSDPDLEASLAVEEMLDQRLWAKSVGLADDREWDCEDEGAACEDEGAHDSDREPNLGWRNVGALDVKTGSSDDYVTHDDSLTG